MGFLYFLLFLMFVICVVVIVAWVTAIKLYISVISEKGYAVDNSIRGKIWLIGLFATPIAAGIYVNSLPDRSPPAHAETSDSVPSNDVLPNL